MIVDAAAARQTFLVAEDDATVGRTLARTLGRHGDAKVVKTYRAARRALEAEAFSALVVDVGLPDGSGLDLVAAARARDVTMPILVVSGEVDKRRLSEAHALGAHFLLKPIDAAELDLFVERLGGRDAITDRRVCDLVTRWELRYALTPTEAELLELGARGTPRSELHVPRRVEASTVKKQVHNMLEKTGDASFEAAVSRLLRELVGRP